MTWPRFAVIVAATGIGVGVGVFAVLVAIDELVKRSITT